MNKDNFGDRMKELESLTGQRFMPLLPVCARLDGKNFHNYTKDMKRPYDERMSQLMEMTTTFLVKETNAVIGYTQSDEISLIWYSDSYDSQIWFDGRIQKMCSVLASMCTGYFNKYSFRPEKLAFFDCRVWQVPTLEEAANTILWRENDALKNAISMAARCYYSHKELENKTGNEMQELLFSKDINFNDYPNFFKRGTYIQRRKVLRKFSVEEIEKLPLKHEARSNPDLEIERTEYKRVEMPKFSAVKNRVGVIFNGEEPTC